MFLELLIEIPLFLSMGNPLHFSSSVELEVTVMITFPFLQKYLEIIGNGICNLQKYYLKKKQVQSKINVLFPRCLLDTSLHQAKINIRTVSSIKRRGIKSHACNKYS